jgi:nitrous oxide reductase accessory protein NosL
VEAGSYNVTNLSKEKQTLWAGSRERLKQELAVCREHCGGSKECDAKCRRAYDARLEMTYQRLTQEDGAAPKNDIQEAPSCPFCGMDRQKFAHSRVFIEYDDGSVMGSCSIHCAAADLAVNLDKTPRSIWVGDYNHKNLIDAEKAFWVMGGKKMGVMTKRAKWAFEKSQDADQFIKAEGGEVVPFDHAMRASYEDMYEDTKMIRERRKAKRMSQKGIR